MQRIITNFKPSSQRRVAAMDKFYDRVLSQRDRVKVKTTLYEVPRPCSQPIRGGNAAGQRHGFLKSSHKQKYDSAAQRERGKVSNIELCGREPESASAAECSERDVQSS